MDITMDYFEGLEELFEQDITEDYLAESFNTGPIKFENIFDDNQTDQFDSIVPEDISRFLDAEMNEGNNTMCIEEDINLENVLDGNNNTNEIDIIDSVFDFDDLNPEVEDVYQIKQELEEFPENKNGITEPLDFLNLPTSANQAPFADCDHLFTIEHKFQTMKKEQVSESEHASQTMKKEQVSESDEDRSNKKPIGQNRKEIKNVKNIKLEVLEQSALKKKYPILPPMQVDELDPKPKKGKHSPARKVNTKEMKAFQFCDLCPFKTKEKSIFRMHRTLVHKLDVTKCPKKTPQKSDTTRKSCQPPPPKKSKVPESTRHDSVPKKVISITAKEFEKKLASGRNKFTNPSLEDSVFPRYSTTQNGHHMKLSEKTQPNSFVYSIAPLNVNPVKSKPVNFSAFSRNTDTVTKPNSFVYSIAPVNTKPVNVNQVNFNTFSHNTDTVAPVMTNHMPCVVPASSSYISSIISPNTPNNCFVPPSTVGSNSFVPPSTTGLASFVPPNTTGLANFVPPHTTGLSSFVPPNTTGLSSFGPPNTTGLTSFVPPNTTGLASFVPPNTSGLSSIAKLPKVSTMTSGQLLSAKPGIVRVASCKIISPAPRKFVSILPKAPQCLISRFQQPTGKNPRPNNGRLLRNSQERQRRNETKQALQTVKNLVPRLKFAEKPPQITILKETIKYVKYLQKEELEDLQELEAQRKTFVKLKSKWRCFVSRS